MGLQEILQKNYCAGWYDIENDARDGSKGMWSDPYIVPPWEWRKNKKNKQKQPGDANTDQRLIPPANNTGIFHGNVKSRKYHKSGCQVYDCKNCIRNFNSSAEAEEAGFAPCHICNPQEVLNQLPNYTRNSIFTARLI